MLHYFAGALAYADDNVLLAPTVREMRSMLRICEKYANEFDVIFNASKSKCVICLGRGAVHHCSPPTLPFTLCENVIEIVNDWFHLDHNL